MKSARSYIFFNSPSIPPIQNSPPTSHQNYLQIAKKKATTKITQKYRASQNYMIISQINRIIMEKQCTIKTTLNDIRYNHQDQKLQAYYPLNISTSELPVLIEYYKYYSQKPILYMKEYYSLLYQHQQKRKVVEYKRLKVLLNLSESNTLQNSLLNKKKNNYNSRQTHQSGIGISRDSYNHEEATKKKDFLCNKILDELSLSNLSTDNENQQSLLINRLRNNLSKHIGPSHIKNMSIVELDEMFDFQLKKEIFKPHQKKSCLINFANQKRKLQSFNPKKIQRQQTRINHPQQMKQKNITRRRINRNNSCQNHTRISTFNNPTDRITQKLKRKKNLSMDNICKNTSTPYILDESKQTVKNKIIALRGEEKQKEDITTIKVDKIFLESINELKKKIKKKKQLLLKTSCQGPYTNLKKQKIVFTTINNSNQRFTKKNYQRLQQKIINVL